MSSPTVELASDPPQEAAAPQERSRRPRRAARAKRRHHPLRWLVAGMIVAAGVYWLGWHSPWTTVTQLGVTVPKGISARDVRTASGITQASHVSAVDAGAVELAIMQAIPEVAAVQVQRKLPHTVNLVVTARSPLAAVAVGSDYVLIDDQSVPYKRVKRVKGLPVVAAQTDAGREAALAVLAAVPAGLRERIATVRATTTEDVVLVLTEGAQVRWGSATDAQLKTEVLAALMKVRAQLYDVSAPMLPTTEGEIASPSPTPAQ